MIDRLYFRGRDRDRSDARDYAHNEVVVRAKIRTHLLERHGNQIRRYLQGL